MKIEELIKQTSDLLKSIQTFLDEKPGEAPHLVNAAGHLAQAHRNLQGHAARLAADAAAPAAAPVK